MVRRKVGIPIFLYMENGLVLGMLEHLLDSVNNGLSDVVEPFLCRKNNGM
jgi:hypothetical protein